MPKIILVIGVTLALVVFIEAVTRSSMVSGAEVTAKMAAGNTRLVVLYAGLMNDVSVQFGRVAEWYATNGYDIIKVGRTGLYCAECTAKAAADAVEAKVRDKHYERVVFDGLSLGGRAAVDTLKLLRHWFTPLPEVTLVLEGAPMTYKSVLGPLKYGAWVAARIPFGWLSSRVPVIDWIFVPPRRRISSPVSTEKPWRELWRPLVGRVCLCTLLR